MKKAFLIILIFLGGVIIFDTVETYFYVKTGITIAQNTKPFERKNPHATMRILITGDSTAYGTGATEGIYSVAGRFAEAYPSAEVINLSRNGLRLAGLATFLEGKKEESFNIIVAQIGANDIIYFTPLNDVESELLKVVETLSSMGGHVAVLHSGDIGSAPLFPWYVSPFYTYRTYLVRSIYKDIIDTYENVVYVDLFEKDNEVFYKNDPVDFSAPDGLHLNNEGYGLWFSEIEKALRSQIKT